MPDRRQTPPGVPPKEQPNANDAGTPRAIDPRIIRALARMTSELTSRFTVASLAKIAGMSRAAFARRFSTELGTPPLRYLAELRLAHAAKLLVEEGTSLGQLSKRVGYESEFALSRAFKRKFGEAPASFRKRYRAAASTIRSAA